MFGDICISHTRRPDLSLRLVISLFHTPLYILDLSYVGDITISQTMLPRSKFMFCNNSISHTHAPGCKFLFGDKYLFFYFADPATRSEFMFGDISIAQTRRPDLSLCLVISLLLRPCPQISVYVWWYFYFADPAPGSKFMYGDDDTHLIINDLCKTCGPGGDLMTIQCNSSNEYGYTFASGFLNVLRKL